MRKKRKNRGEKGINLIILIILIPVLGTLLGYAVSQKVLIPYFVEKEEGVQETVPVGEAPEKDTQPGEEDQSQPVVAYQRIFDIEGMDVFCIQVGAFSTGENAERMVEELHSKEMAGSIRKDRMFKVYSLYSFNEEIARKQLDRVREVYSDAHISSIGYPSVGISYPDNASAEAEELGQQIRETRQMIITAADSAAAGKSIRSMISEQLTRTQQFKKKLETRDKSSPLSEYHNEAIKMYEAIINACSGTGADDEKQTAMDLVGFYLDFLERIGQMI